MQVEYSGEDDFDQINVSAIPGSTNNQNGRFEFLDAARGGTGLAIANAALGLFSNYAELGQRNFTKWRSLATDVFVQDSWKPTSQLTIEGGFRWVSGRPGTRRPTTSPTSIRASTTRRRRRSSTRRPAGSIGGSALQRRRPAGRRLRGRCGERSVASNPRILALFRGEPRGFSETHYNAFEPRLGVSYALDHEDGHPRQRRHLPQPRDAERLDAARRQPAVPAAGHRSSNGNADNPAGGTVGAADLPFGINGQDPVFKHPTSYMWARRRAARTAARLHRRRHLRRPPRPLPAARAQHQPAAGRARCRPTRASTSRRCVPTRATASSGCRRTAGNSKYNSLQISADRRYSERSESRLGLHARQVRGQRQQQAQRALEHLRRHRTTGGPSDFDRRHVVSFYYIYDLPFWRDQSTLMKNLLGGWQISGASFFRTGTPFSVAAQQRHRGRRRRRVPPAGQPRRRRQREREQAVLERRRRRQLLVQPGGVRRPAAGTFGNAPRNLLYNPGEQQWDIALFKNFNAGRHAPRAVPRRVLQLPEPPELGQRADGRRCRARVGRIRPTRPSDA